MLLVPSPGFEQCHGPDLFDHCTFTGNSAQDDGGAVFLAGDSPNFDHCTFDRNSTLNGSAGGTILCSTITHTGIPSNPVLNNCILGFAAEGAAIHCLEGSVPTLRCCDVFGNSGGDWYGCIAGQAGEQGNLALDPLFCGAEHGDYTLNAASPCAPIHNPECGRIGAWPVACGAAVGACCLSDGSCFLATPEDCAGHQGRYRGDGIPCGLTPCVPVATRSVTWGRIKSMYRDATR